MSQQTVSAGSGRLILLFKSAYWIALLIIVAMALASYLLLQQMMAAQQRDQSLLAIAGTQKALSQRVVFLATATDRATRAAKPGLLASLKEATAEFDRNEINHNYLFDFA